VAPRTLRKLALVPPISLTKFCAAIDSIANAQNLFWLNGGLV
jgi:hypothetical protein